MRLLTKANRFSKVILLVSILFSIAACSGNRVVVTTDDSADYQSARQIPPLNKSIENLPAVSAGADQFSGASSSILQVSDDIVRMNIDAGIDVAWETLSNDVRNSEITLQGRNRSANQIEIGCGSINDGSTNVDDSGGWSIFKNELIFEYCVLQLEANRDQTIVQLLDRRGEEVNGVDAMSIFTKIVNN